MTNYNQQDWNGWFRWDAYDRWRLIQTSETKDHCELMTEIQYRSRLDIFKDAKTKEYAEWLVLPKEMDPNHE